MAYNAANLRKIIHGGIDNSIAGNIWTSNVYLVNESIPAKPWHITSTIVITSDRVYLLALIVVLVASLWALYRFSRFGVGTNAVSENPRAAASLGWSFDLIAAVNWGLGCALVGLASIFLVPIIGLDVSDMTALLLVTVAAALVGNFNSFWLTLLGGLGIGVIQGEINYYSQIWGSWSSGLAASVPFFLILIMLVVRGRSLPLRDYFRLRNPMVGSGRIRPRVAITAFALLLVITAMVDANWATGFARRIMRRRPTTRSRPVPCLSPSSTRRAASALRQHQPVRRAPCEG